MSFSRRCLAVFSVAMLVAIPSRAELLTVPEYPPIGNVQVGCQGVDQCVVYFSGGGTTTLQDIQETLQDLTFGLFPSTVGIIAHRPTGSLLGKLVYSSADLNTARTNVSQLSSQFGTHLHTVGISEGVRAMREAQTSYGSATGLWVEIDQFSPYETPPVLATLDREQFVAYHGQYSSNLQATWHTGPPSLENPSFPFYTIALDGIEAGEFVASFHVGVIPLGVTSAHAVLRLRVLDNVAGIAEMLRWQQTNQWVEAPTTNGTPAVTSPPLGSGPTAPSGGGGLGVESFPAWLVRQEQQYAVCKTD